MDAEVNLNNYLELILSATAPNQRKSERVIK